MANSCQHLPNRDANGFQLLHYRVVYYAEIGWVGDAEGRTWARQLKYWKSFADPMEAVKWLDSHPDIEKVSDEEHNESLVWLSDRWKTRYNYGLVRIRRCEELLK